RPGDNGPCQCPAVAGGDEGDAGRQRVTHYKRGGIGGPVVGEGDGVGEVLSGVDGGRPGLGDGEVGDFRHGGRDLAGRGRAVVVGRVGVDGRGIGARDVEQGAGRGEGGGGRARQARGVGERCDRGPGDD